MLKEARETRDRLSEVWREASHRAAEAAGDEQDADLEWSAARRRVKKLEQAMKERHPGYLDPYEEDSSRWSVGRSVKIKSEGK